MNYQSTQNDLFLVVCGSATSWIIDNLLGDRGGFYNRITCQIHLRPFTLGECEELYQLNDIQMTRQQMIESYMIFGGIPSAVGDGEPLTKALNELEQSGFLRKYKNFTKEKQQF